MTDPRSRCPAQRPRRRPAPATTTAACQDLRPIRATGEFMFDSLTIARQLTEAGDRPRARGRQRGWHPPRLPSTATGSLSAEGRSPGAAGAGLFDL